MTAVGVHALETKKLGKRHVRAYRPKIPVGQFLNLGLDLTVPPYPLDDPMVLALQYPMDENDVAGDCVVAGTDHALQIIHALLGVTRQNWTASQILRYYQTQNPGFTSWASAGGPDDQGMYVDQFLSYLVSEGTLLGYGSVDPTKADELQAAQYLGLSLVVGQTLQVAQQRSNVWDYVAGSPTWGEHCTCWNAYTHDPQFKTVSWGSDQYEVTDQFVVHQVDEVYLLLTKAQVDQPGFRDNFDLAGFGAAFTSLTGKPFPVAPTPSPTTYLDLKATGDEVNFLTGWATKRHAGDNRTAAQDVQAIIKRSTT